MTTPSEPKPGIRWWRVIGGAFFLELALTLIAVVFYSMRQEQALMLVVPPATLVFAVLFGAWAARGTARPVLNGLLVGVVSFVIYVVLLLGNVLFAPQQPDLTLTLSASYLASHVFKVLGGWAGGWWVARKGAGAAQAA